MRKFLLLLASTSDHAFHDWCNFVGIDTPFAKLLTTPKSVAGRGVFATQDVEAGAVTIRIPENVVLHEYTAAANFPELAKAFGKQKKIFKRRKSLWNRLLHRQRKAYEFTSESDFWQAELTKYSLACIESENFWAPWIGQWQRCDPMQTLYQNKILPDGESQITSCVEEIRNNFLPNEDPLRIRAAVDIRLRRYYELKEIFDLGENASSMYGILTSRAIELDSGVCGVIPMFDMVNHSREPNLILSYDEGSGAFEMKARRKIKEGEEFFVCYEDEDVKRDEYSALWAAVQWGIPSLEQSIGSAKEDSVDDGNMRDLMSLSK